MLPAFRYRERVKFSLQVTPVDKVRVVLAEMPEILRYILRDLLSKQADMEVVGEVRSPASLPTAVASFRAEVVILTLSPASESSLCALREQYPGLALLGAGEGQ